MNIRRLEPEHASIYRTLMLEAYERHPDAFTSSASERAALPLSWWERRLSIEPKQSEIVFGIFINTQLVAVAGLSFEYRQKVSHKATLFGMYVHTAFRGHGYGTRLVNEVLKEAMNCPSVKLVQLTVTSGNQAAYRLYESSGFREFGFEPYAVAVGDGYVSKVHMWRPNDAEFSVAS